MSRNLFWLSDEQWQRIEAYLPTDVRGVERQDNRRIMDCRERDPRMRRTGQDMEISGRSRVDLAVATDHSRAAHFCPRYPAMPS
jgi:transposase